MRISDWSSDVCSSDLIDVGIGTQKAREIPFLPLAAIPPLPELYDQILGPVVGQPAGRFGDDLHQPGGDSGFLLHFAERGDAGLLALVDTALGHLPRSEEHPSELQSPMRHSSAVFCLKTKK